MQGKFEGISSGGIVFSFTSKFNLLPVNLVLQIYVLTFLEQSLLTTDYYVKNCEQESFGIFLFGKIDQLLNKNLFVQCERILNSIEQRNQTFFAQREYKDENKYNNCRIF